MPTIYIYNQIYREGLEKGTGRVNPGGPSLAAGSHREGRQCALGLPISQTFMLSPAVPCPASGAEPGLLIPSQQLTGLPLSSDSNQTLPTDQQVPARIWRNVPFGGGGFSASRILQLVFWEMGVQKASFLSSGSCTTRQHHDGYNSVA